MEDKREQAWKYFELHAGQRMSIFNFYITLSTAIVAALGVFIGISAISPWLIGTLGSLMVVFSLVFWGLDKRTKDLIHLAEDKILDLEKHDPANIMSIFKTERNKSDKQRFRIISYSFLFRVIYLIFIVIGLTLLILTVTHNLPIIYE